MVENVVPIRTDVRSPEPFSAQQFAIANRELNDRSLEDLARVTFFSPVLSLDVDAGLIVLSFRDSESGELQRQVPSERQLDAFQSGLAVPAESLARFVVDNPPDIISQFEAVSNLTQPELVPDVGDELAGAVAEDIAAGTASEQQQALAFVPPSANGPVEDQQAIPVEGEGFLVQRNVTNALDGSDNIASSGDPFFPPDGDVRTIVTATGN